MEKASPCFSWYGSSLQFSSGFSSLTWLRFFHLWVLGLANTSRTTSANFSFCRIWKVQKLHAPPTRKHNDEAHDFLVDVKVSGHSKIEGARGCMVMSFCIQRELFRDVHRKMTIKLPTSLDFIVCLFFFSRPLCLALADELCCSMRIDRHEMKSQPTKRWCCERR